MDIESTVRATKEKIESIAREKQNVINHRKAILEKKEWVSRKIHQIKVDHTEILQMLAGPPRREPRLDEQRQIHILMNQLNNHNAEATNLQITEKIMNDRISRLSEDENKVKENLQKKSLEYEIIFKQVEDLDVDRNSMPMVVGRSIGYNSTMAAVCMLVCIYFSLDIIFMFYVGKYKRHAAKRVFEDSSAIN